MYKKAKSKGGLVMDRRLDSTARAANRPTTIGTNGMVTSTHYLASQAGLEVLKQGGNAVEAAIAAASTIAVVNTPMNSIGGDNFWLIYNAKTDELKGLNASGRAGEKATIDFFTSKGYSEIPVRGYLAANTVPGAISGWWEAYNYARTAMGSKLPWDKLLTPAIDYAESGFPVGGVMARTIKSVLRPDPVYADLGRFEGFRRTYLKPDDTVYQLGEVFKQKDLARTLQIIAQKGTNGFYQGEIAERMVADLQANGGVLTLSDFAKHKANWVDPIAVPYRQHTAYNLPPNTQGLASLTILNILNNYDLRNMGEGSADYYHVLVEATKQAFADRDKWVTDPEFVNIPLKNLLSVKHGADLSKRIDLKQAAGTVHPLDPNGDTIWLGVVDKDGNAVSLIQSIYHGFGSGIVPQGTGVLLQNRGCFFSLDSNHINRIEPGKRTMHTLNPAMLFKEGKPYLIYGTMGGEGQGQTQAAIVTRIVDFNFSVQDAIEAPRFVHGRTSGAPMNDLRIEGRIAKDVVQELIVRGHPLKVVDDYNEIMGHAGGILIDQVTKVKYGGADPRGDGTAVGY
jgi:gamma-glutamyltranspeptidase/glutathione hydrolase